MATADGAAQLLLLELLRELPEVDILVNNLGIFGAVRAREITDEQWRTYFEVNVLAAARLIRMYLPGMIERGWGMAVQIASDSALGRSNRFSTSWVMPVGFPALSPHLLRAVHIPGQAARQVPAGDDRGCIRRSSTDSICGPRKAAARKERLAGDHAAVAGLSCLLWTVLCQQDRRRN